MKLSFSIMFLLLAVSLTTAQNCELQPQEILSQLELEIEFIDSITYNAAKAHPDSERQIQIETKTEQELVTQHPEIFQKEDGCYVFKSVEGEKFLACPKDETSDDRKYSRYKFNGVICNHAIISTQDFEDYQFLLVNLTDGIAIPNAGQPFSIDCRHVISSFNLYGVGIGIVDLKSKKQFSVSTMDWVLSSIKIAQDGYYFKLESSYVNCQTQPKFLRIVSK
jgi:hypothetical protein